MSVKLSSGGMHVVCAFEDPDSGSSISLGLLLPLPFNPVLASCQNGGPKKMGRQAGWRHESRAYDLASEELLSSLQIVGWMLWKYIKN